MTSTEFNEKYKDYKERGFYGLDFDIPIVTDYLDKEFIRWLYTGITRSKEELFLIDFNPDLYKS